MPDKKRYGLIGFPLQHSFSPAYFKKKFSEQHIDAEYQLFPLQQISDLPALLTLHPDLNGLNVTIPFKTAVLPYLTQISEAAAQIGAVNCIVCSNNQLIGYNTDVIGFELSLKPLLQQHHQSALILGTGGAANAVAFVLVKLGIAFSTVSRHSNNNKQFAGATAWLTYDELTENTVREHTLIINTTPLGMHPNIAACPPIPYAAITEQHLLYDLVYNPETTLLLQQGKEMGAAIKNGLEMLELQAEAAWQIWNGLG
jgi:shikimate dehydrogenase